jgi:hypothetical protein
MLVIDAPHFYAGLHIDNGVVTKTAPIIRYMLGWSERRVKDYCVSKRWVCS